MCRSFAVRHLKPLTYGKDQLKTGNRFCYTVGMTETFDIPVTVWTEYDHAARRMNIHVVVCDGTQYDITKLAHHYTERQGRVLVHVFCAATETVTLKLRFNTETLQWRCVERRVYGMD